MRKIPHVRLKLLWADLRAAPCCVCCVLPCRELQPRLSSVSAGVEVAPLLRVESANKGAQRVVRRVVHIAACCVNEIWRKSSGVVVRTAGRLITLGLAAALIRVLCKIHNLPSVSSHHRLPPPPPPHLPHSLPPSLPHAHSHTHTLVRKDMHAPTSHVHLPLSTLTLSSPDART